MNLTAEELQYILNAIDTHVREKGLSVAAFGVAIAGKIQAAAKTPVPAPPPPDEGGDKPPED